MEKMAKTELKRNWGVLVGIVLSIFLVSVITVVASLYFLSATQTGESIRTKLGLNNLKSFTINTTKTETVNVQESSAVIDANKNVSPAVVSITSKGTSVQNVFGYGTIQAPTISGTGMIVTSDGLVATNKHVVSGNTNFTITTSDGKSYAGTVVGTDPVEDIALIKIDAHGLPVVNLGDSDSVQVGQWVIAIGNALGEFQNTVTVGVVSGLNRVASPSDGAGNTENLDGLIQTDAAINPGNSGGPLLNLQGQVVGINTAIAGDAQGLGFVIPSNELKKSLDSYTKNGKILRPYIGVQYEAITNAVAKNLNLPTQNGALITSSTGSPIVSGSPAEKAGLKSNDIITKINSTDVNETNPLSKVIRGYNPGDSITLTILRDGKTVTVDLTLGVLGK